jgi:hypothetical protein
LIPGVTPGPSFVRSRARCLVCASTFSHVEATSGRDASFRSSDSFAHCSCSSGSGQFSELPCRSLKTVIQPRPLPVISRCAASQLHSAHREIIHCLHREILHDASLTKTKVQRHNCPHYPRAKPMFLGRIGPPAHVSQSAIFGAILSVRTAPGGACRAPMGTVKTTRQRPPGSRRRARLGSNCEQGPVGRFLDRPTGPHASTSSN